jgi:hypothetical protein
MAGTSRGRNVLGPAGGAALAAGTLVPAASAQFEPFTEEAAARGVVYETGQYTGFGLGMAFADLDGDGDADLVVVGREDGRVGVYRNDGTGHFALADNDTGIPYMPSASGVIAADYDADGDLDLYFTNWVTPNVLVRNEGGFRFTDVSAAAGVDDPGAGTGAAWGDIDGDGWLDLFVANRTGSFGSLVPDRLYRNLGDGTFVDVLDAVGIDAADAAGFQGVFFDYDVDGDADLYVSNDRGVSCPGIGFENKLWENVGGSFVDVTGQSGTGACINSMGVAVGDLDRNGFPDLYATNTQQGNVLYLNQGDGTFVEAAVQAGVAMFEIGWAAVFFDFDHDLHLDLFVANMIGGNFLLRHEGVFPCGNVAASLALDDAGASFCAAVADIDLDGDLDLVMSNQESGVPSPVRLYVNHEGEQRAWIRLDVVGQGPNTYGVGTRLRVRTDYTDHYREVHAGMNYKAQNEMTRHVGLGDARFVDVTVDWPSGDRRTLSNLPTEQTWTLYPPEKLGDADQDGDIDADDLRHFIDCYSGSAATALPPGLRPGCEMMDLDGDGDVDMADLHLLLDRLDAGISAAS